MGQQQLCVCPQQGPLSSEAVMPEGIDAGLQGRYIVQLRANLMGIEL